MEQRGGGEWNTEVREVRGEWNIEGEGNGT